MPHSVSPTGEPFNALQGHQAHAQHHLGAVDQREPLFGPQLKRCPPELRKRLAGWQSTSVGHGHLAQANQGQHHVRQGAKSPEAPNEPCSGTTGSTLAFQWSNKRCTVVSATPEWPWDNPFTLSKSIMRTTS